MNIRRFIFVQPTSMHFSLKMHYTMSNGRIVSYSALRCNRVYARVTKGVNIRLRRRHVDYVIMWAMTLFMECDG